MAKPENDTPYYAIKSETPSASENGGKWASSTQSLEVGSISLANAQAGDTVSCKTSVQVTLKSTMAGLLESGDAKMTLTGLGINDATEVDLQTIQATTNTTTYTGNITLDGAEDTEKLTADVWIVNKQEKEQNHIAGKELQVEFKIQASDCATTSPGE